MQTFPFCTFDEIAELSLEVAIECTHCKRQRTGPPDLKDSHLSGRLFTRTRFVCSYKFKLWDASPAQVCGGLGRILIDPTAHDFIRPGCSIPHCTIHCPRCVQPRQVSQAAKHRVSVGRNGRHDACHDGRGQIRNPPTHLHRAPVALLCIPNGHRQQAVNAIGDDFVVAAFAAAVASVALRGEGREESTTSLQDARAVNLPRTVESYRPRQPSALFFKPRRGSAEGPSSSKPSNGPVMTRHGKPSVRCTPTVNSNAARQRCGSAEVGLPAQASEVAP